MTPSGIEPATLRFVAQHLNHCATAVPSILCITSIIHLLLYHCYCHYHYHRDSEWKALLNIATSYTDHVCHTLCYFLQGLVYHLMIKVNENE